MARGISTRMMAGRKFYEPTNEGREKLLAQRMEEIRRVKEGKR